MNKITFEDATLVSQAKVSIGGTDYEITPATYSGGTDLNASTFNTMQSNIENAIPEVQTSKTTSDSDTYACTYVNNALIDEYSTSEVKTNKVWIDGRPIYRTVIDKGDIAIPRGNGTLFTHGISNIRQITKCICIIYSASNGYASYGTYADSDGYKQFSADNTNVIYAGTTYLSSGYGSNKAFILEYTKTTD